MTYRLTGIDAAPPDATSQRPFLVAVQRVTLPSDIVSARFPDIVTFTPVAAPRIRAGGGAREQYDVRPQGGVVAAAVSATGAPKTRIVPMKFTHAADVHVAFGRTTTLTEMGTKRSEPT